MKQIVKYGVIAFIAVLLLSSCEEDSTNNGTNDSFEFYTNQPIPINPGCSPYLMNNGGYYSPYTSFPGRSAYEIRYELDKAYKLLYDMEEQMYNSTGVTRSACPQMIAHQRQFILRLENELRNATH